MYEHTVGDYEKVMNFLIRLGYQPKDTKSHVSDVGPTEKRWNSNHPIFSIDTLWVHPYNDKFPHILVCYSTRHGHHESFSLYGTIHTGKVMTMRAGMEVRGTKEHNWSGFNGLVDLTTKMDIPLRY